MTMYVGAILGDAGRINDQFSDFLVKLRRIKDRWHDKVISATDGSLDLVFHTEGRILTPEFEYMRTGRFSAKQRMLQIQIAASLEIISSPKMGQYVVDALAEAVKLGKTYFDKKKIEFDLDSHLALVAKLREGLAIGDS